MDTPASQRWTERRPSWAPTTDGGFDPARYRVDQIDLPTARRFVETHHYARSWPADRFRYGLWLTEPDRHEILVGVAVFGIPTSRKALTNVFPDLEPYVESVELSRLVLLGGRGQTGGLAPANAESWFVARCNTELAAAGVRGVLSFSDPVPRPTPAGPVLAGHVGIVYQAINATFLGRATARPLTLLPDGTVLSDRAAQKVRAAERGHAAVQRRLIELGAPPLADGQDPARWLRDALDTVGAIRLRHRGNLRYAWPVGDRNVRRRTRIAGDRLPYVKVPDPAPRQLLRELETRAAGLG